MEQVTLTRKELYDLVWAEPLSRLAKRYKISDNGLRKICKRMNIPIPAMGHWQKIQYNKKVTIIKLPETDITIHTFWLKEIINILWRLLLLVLKAFFVRI